MPDFGKGYTFTPLSFVPQSSNFIAEIRTPVNRPEKRILSDIPFFNQFQNIAVFQLQAIR